MSYVLLNPESLCGTPGDPPEYRATEPVRCYECREVYDRTDNLLEVDGRNVCVSCASLCDCCGEYIEDTNPAGPMVRFALSHPSPLFSGKLSKPHHARCAAEYIVGQGEDVSDYTKEQIAEAMQEWAERWSKVAGGAR